MKGPFCSPRDPSPEKETQSPKHSGAMFWSRNLGKGSGAKSMTMDSVTRGRGSSPLKWHVRSLNSEG